MTATVTQMRRPSVEPGTFEEFWQACPKLMRDRSPKPVVERWWTELTTTGRECKIPYSEDGQHVETVREFLKATPQEILCGLNSYIEEHYDSHSFKYDRFLMGAGKFLNQGRWMR